MNKNNSENIQNTYDVDRCTPYPAEVHFSIIVESNFSADLEIAKILENCEVIRPLADGKSSKAGKYRALHVSVMVCSREKLDELDIAFRKVPGVKLLL